MHITIPAFPTGERPARMFWPTDADLGSVYVRSDYDVILMFWGGLWLLGGLVLMLAVHWAIVAEHARVRAEEARAVKVAEPEPSTKTARAAYPSRRRYGLFTASSSRSASMQSSRAARCPSPPNPRPELRDGDAITIHPGRHVADPFARPGFSRRLPGDGRP